MKTWRIEVRRKWGLRNWFYCTQPFTMLVLYEVCLQSNETGAIIFLINNRTTNQLQSSSLGKPHTATDVAPTPGSSVGSLHVEVPSAGLSRPFGCCPQFQNDDFWCGIWVSGKGRSRSCTGQLKFAGAPSRLNIAPYCQRNFFTAVASKSKCLLTSTDVNFFFGGGGGPPLEFIKNF